MNEIRASVQRLNPVTPFAKPPWFSTQGRLKFCLQGSHMTRIGKISLMTTISTAIQILTSELGLDLWPETSSLQPLHIEPLPNVIINCITANRGRPGHPSCRILVARLRRRLQNSFEGGFESGSWLTVNR